MSTTASADTGTLATGAPGAAPWVAAVAGDSAARAKANANTSPAPRTASGSHTKRHCSSRTPNARTKWESPERPPGSVIG